jgi:hypothetical protein
MKIIETAIVPPSARLELLSPELISLGSINSASRT